MELLEKMLTIFSKKFMIDVAQGPKYELAYRMT